MAQQPDSRVAFRSRTDLQHLGAFFELYLHELMLRLGCTLSFHPVVTGTTKRPDYLVTDPYGNEFFLEATVEGDESDIKRRAQARVAHALHHLDQLEAADFGVAVIVDSIGPNTLPGRRLRNFVEQHLGALRAAAPPPTAATGRIEWRFEHDGWIVRVRPVTRNSSRAARRVISMTSTMTVRRIDTVPGVEGGGRQKGEALRRCLGKPYIIAVNVVGDWGIEEDGVARALYGDEVYTFNVQTDRPD